MAIGIRSRTAAAAVTALALCAQIPQAEASGPLRRVPAERPTFLAGNGEDKVAFGRPGTGLVTVVDTRRRTRERYRVPRDCSARFEQVQRAFAGDRLLLRCGRVPRYGAVILDVATGSVSPLPTQLAGVDPGTPSYWYIGRNWVYGEGRCAGATCPLYLKLDTGEVVVSSFDTTYDLDAPTAQPLDGCRRSESLGVRAFDDPFRFDFVGRRIVVSRCGEGGIVAERRGSRVSRVQIQLYAGWLTWTRGRVAKAFQPVTGRRMRWGVPGHDWNSIVAVHTSNRIFVADIAGESDYGAPTRLRIFRGNLR